MILKIEKFTQFVYNMHSLKKAGNTAEITDLG